MGADAWTTLWLPALQIVWRIVRQKELSPLGWDKAVLLSTLGGGNTSSKGVPNHICWFHDDLVDGKGHSAVSRGLKNV